MLCAFYYSTTETYTQTFQILNFVMLFYYNVFKNNSIGHRVLINIEQFHGVKLVVEFLLSESGTKPLHQVEGTHGFVGH